MGDRDIVQYNLADPVSAYNYVTFISNLALIHGPRLFSALRASKIGLSSRVLSWVTDDQKAKFIELGYKPLPAEKKKKGPKNSNKPQINPKDKKDEGKPQTITIPSVHLSDHEQVKTSQARDIDTTPAQHMETRSRRTGRRAEQTGGQIRRSNE